MFGQSPVLITGVEVSGMNHYTSQSEWDQKQKARQKQTLESVQDNLPPFWLCLAHRETAVKLLWFTLWLIYAHRVSSHVSIPLLHSGSARWIFSRSNKSCEISWKVQKMISKPHYFSSCQSFKTHQYSLQPAFSPHRLAKHNWSMKIRWFWWEVCL